jgi:hypothetical protein
MNHYDMPIRVEKRKHLDDLESGTMMLSNTPTCGDSILVNDWILGYQNGWDDGRTELTVDITDGQQSVILSRSDQTPIQILNAHRDNLGQVFKDPIEGIQLYKDESGLWVANLDPTSVLNKHGLVTFVEVVSQHALSKQRKQRQLMNSSSLA